MEQFKISHTKNNIITTEDIVYINDNLTDYVLKSMNKKIIRAKEVGLYEDIVAIGLSESGYISIIKELGNIDKYNNIPIVIQPTLDSVIKFKPRVNLIYPNDVLYVNTGRK